jgi:large subunit ribosomal protein L33
MVLACEPVCETRIAIFGITPATIAPVDIRPIATRLPANQAHRPTTGTYAMAKATTIKVKLVSSADTGYYYVAKKNSRTMTDKLVKKKYDPVAKKHVEFRESKIK